MARTATGKVKKGVLSMRCPSCGGKCIRYGIVSWSSRLFFNEFARYQRVRCKECHRLTYHFIDTIKVVSVNNVK